MNRWEAKDRLSVPIDHPEGDTPTRPVSVRALAREIDRGRHELHAVRTYVRRLLVLTGCELAVLIVGVVLYAAHWWVVK
jgi:hypothetical protein